MSETQYIVPRCTYLELRDSAGNHAYTITAAACKDLNCIPLAVEDFPELSEKQETLIRCYMQWIYGHCSDEDLIRRADNASFKLKYRTVSLSDGGTTKDWYYLDASGNEWTLENLLDRARAKAYLTADGVDLITKLSGGRLAYDLSNMDLYILSPFAQQVEVQVNEDPIPDPLQPKKEEKNTGKLGAILLALASIVLFK